jgi:hypothetical protein
MLHGNNLLYHMLLLVILHHLHLVFKFIYISVLAVGLVKETIIPT